MSISGPGGGHQPEYQPGAAAGEAHPGLEKASARSVEVRTRRSEIKRQLEEREALAHCVMGDPALANLYVRRVLKWQHGWGDRKVGACLGAMGAFNPTCSQLSERQIAITSYYCTWKPRTPEELRTCGNIPPIPPDAISTREDQ